jgi:hypothetical protein
MIADSLLAYEHIDSACSTCAIRKTSRAFVRMECLCKAKRSYQPIDVQMATKDYTCTTSYRGHEVTVLQVPREKTEDSDNTGWAVWECSNICLRYLVSDENAAKVLGLTHRGRDEAPPPPRFEALRVMDLSAGAGLLTIAFAKAGAETSATDIPAQLPQLVDNVRRAGLTVVGADGGGSASSAPTRDVLAPAEPVPAVPCTGTKPVVVAPLFWGESLEALQTLLRQAASKPAAACGAEAGATGGRPPLQAFQIGYDCDIAFIAVRDGRTVELKQTLTELLRRRVCRAILFGYEERLFREEEAMMRDLGLGYEPPTPAATAPDVEATVDGTDGAAEQRAIAISGIEAAAASHTEANAPAPPLIVEELKGSAVDLEFEDSLAKQGAGGHADTDLFNPYLFWTPPPVRLFILRLRE